jgi:Spy/CpxP family protein refolding chaperone
VTAAAIIATLVLPAVAAMTVAAVIGEGLVAGREGAGAGQRHGGGNEQASHRTGRQQTRGQGMQSIGVRKTSAAHRNDFYCGRHTPLLAFYSHAKALHALVLI